MAKKTVVATKKPKIEVIATKKPKIEVEATKKPQKSAFPKTAKTKMC